MSINLGELGPAQLLCRGREEAVLIFDGGREYYLSFRTGAYGVKVLELVPYEFLAQRKEIEKVFREKDWEVFMVRVQCELRKAGYKVDIMGWLETKDGKILKSPDYAERPSSNWQSYPETKWERFRRRTRPASNYMPIWLLILVGLFALYFF